MSILKSYALDRFDIIAPTQDATCLKHFKCEIFEINFFNFVKLINVNFKSISRFVHFEHYFLYSKNQHVWILSNYNLSLSRHIKISKLCIGLIRRNDKVYLLFLEALDKLISYLWSYVNWLRKLAFGHNLVTLSQVFLCFLSCF